MIRKPNFYKTVVLLGDEYRVNYAIRCSILVSGSFEDGTKIDDGHNLYEGHAFVRNDIDSNEYGDSIIKTIGSRADSPSEDKYRTIWIKVSEFSKEALNKEISLTNENALIKKHLEDRLRSL
tara:strand:+ start:158 stop:523 length:366 start_codon:yes stop_codon:yes gene_type:complete